MLMDSWSTQLLGALHPVLIFSNGIGDHLLNLPAIRALATLFNGRLALICDQGARRTFFSDVPLRAVCEIESETIGYGKVFDAGFVAQMLGPCDLLLSLNPWHSPSLDRLLQILSPKHSIGFFPGFDVVLERNYGKHSSELAFDLPRRIDSSLVLDDFADPPSLPTHYVRLAQRIRRRIPQEFHVLAVHAETKLEKMWCRTRFTSFLKRFLDLNPDFIVFELGEGNQVLDSGSDDSPIIPCHGLPLEVSMSLVAQADLFLGVDSCLLHAADLFRVPGVGLFGPTNWQEWGFRFTRGRHVSGNGSMERIAEATVLDALQSLLFETAASKGNARPDTLDQASHAYDNFASARSGIGHVSPGAPKMPQQEFQTSIAGSHERNGNLLPASEARIWDLFREKGYEIRGCHVRSYLSAIYKAIRVSDGQPVAIKILAPAAVHDHESKDLVRRFAREVKALCLMRDQAGTVTIIDAGNIDGWPYHVCDWVPGQAVMEFLDSRITLDLAATLRIVLQTARSVQCMHDRGLAHRDIAPDHIFVDTHGKVQVIDFGMAELFCESPEMAVRRYISQDIRAIGLILYEMWMGQSVFSYGRPIVTEEVARTLQRLDAIAQPSRVVEIIKLSIRSGMRSVAAGREPYRDVAPLVADLRVILGDRGAFETSFARLAETAPCERST